MTAETRNDKGAGTLCNLISQGDYWQVLQQAAIQAVTVGGIATMGFYRQTETLGDLQWPMELDPEKRNPSTVADLQATASILQIADSYLRPLTNKLGCSLSYLGEETEFREWLIANLRQNVYESLREPKRFFTARGDVVRVILDAIDGTVNFIYGIPLFCSGLAILIGSVVRVSAIYDPIHHVVYSGVLKGPDDEPEAEAEAWALEVATGNRVDLVQLADRSKNKNIQSGGIGIHLTRSYPKMLHRFVGVRTASEQSKLEKLANAFRGIYAFNSGMIAMVNVARGALGGFVNNTTNLWDVAPGEVLIRACGGTVTSFDGEPIDYSSDKRISVVAAHDDSIHSRILDIVKV